MSLEPAAATSTEETPSVEYARVTAWSVFRYGEYEGDVYKFDDDSEYTGDLWGIQ